MKNTIKRTIYILIQTAAVLAFVGSLSFLHQKSETGKGLSWIEQKDFSLSDKFSDMVAEDIVSIRKLEILKEAFETNDNDDETNILIFANSKNGKISYSLADLKKIAAENGCTVDENTGAIAISGTPEGEADYEIKIASKVYDPFYFDHIAPGPAQGIMKISEMSIDAMQSYAEYIRLKNKYLDKKGNFIYFGYYLNNSNEISIIQNSENSFSDIKQFDKYVFIKADGTCSTNIDPVPDAYKRMSDVFRFADEDEYAFAAGIDTEFPYSDRYKEAAESYASEINAVYSAISMLILAFVIGVLSLVLIIRSSAAKDDAAEGFGDRMSFEVLVLLNALLSLICYVIVKQTVLKAVYITLPASEYAFWSGTAKAACLYLAFVLISCSMYRRSKAGGVFRHSIIGLLTGNAGDPEEAGKVAAKTLFEYAAFVLFNILAAAGITYLYISKGQAFRMITLLIIIAVLLAVDALVFYLLLGQRKQRVSLREILFRISEGETGLSANEELYSGGELKTAKTINNISIGLTKALTEQVKAERLKADLITNVSHDIRTPLTSIINYVDLIKREDPQDEKIKEYVDVLERKSARLKNLTEDLLEASRASSGNIKLDMQRLDIVELAIQAGGEFDDKMKTRGLELDLSTPDTPVYVKADGRHLWRVFENLYNNASKYALENTRVYADVKQENGNCIFTVKNISKEKLNISPDELTERFVRGDVSRSTEGSGLGLSIAKSLTKLMGGELVIEIDGDLYKASVVLKEEKECE